MSCKTIGIICAMQSELKYINAKFDSFTEKKVGSIVFYEGTMEGKRVITAKCGIGKVFAAMCAEAMILTFSPDVILNCGVAGGLADGLRAGDIVVADKVCQHDMDTTAFGDPKGLISTEDGDLVYVPCDEEIVKKLAQIATELGKRNITGTVATGDLFVSTPDVKASIRDSFNAAACEMEGASIGTVCYVNKIPYSILRGISDTASGADEYSMNLDEVALQTDLVALEFVKRF